MKTQTGISVSTELSHEAWVRIELYARRLGISRDEALNRIIEEQWARERREGKL